MIGVIGATGNLGGRVVDRLLERVPAGEVTAAVRDPRSGAALSRRGIRVRHGDYDDPASLATALNGVDRLLLISSPEPDYVRRVRQHATVLEVAQAAGVSAIAYTGLAFADLLRIPLASSHLATEHALRAGKIPFTILRNAFYTELFADPEFAAGPDGGLATSAGHGQLNTASIDDLASAAATVLIEDGHADRTYELTGPRPWTFDDLAKMISAATGRTVAHVAVPPAATGWWADIFRAAQNGLLGHATDHLERIIGRPGRTVEQIVDEEFRNPA